MKPMEKNSTRFVKYHEIKVDKTDLIDDAMGFSIDFHDVCNYLSQITVSPGRKVNSRFLKCIRNEIGKF